MSAPSHTPGQAQREIERLRSDAHHAHLDGRTKRAKTLNGQADKLARAIAKATGAA